MAALEFDIQSLRGHDSDLNRPSIFLQSNRQFRTSRTYSAWDRRARPRI